MKLFTILMFLTECMISIKSYSSTTCFSHEYDDTSHICKEYSDPLHCNNDVIMIKEIRYAKIENKRYKNCYYCAKNVTTTNLEINHKSFQRNVYEMCSQRNKCSLKGTFESPTNISNYKRYLWYAIISYECVKKGIIYDICSPFEATFNDTDTLHFSLVGDKIASQNCNCVISNDAGNSTITIVDYRPYSVNSSCAIYIFYYENNIPRYQCLNTPTILSTDANIFNKALNVFSRVIHITASLHEETPKMLWFTVKGYQVLVRCNMADSSLSSPITESTTSAKTMTTFEPSPTSSSTGGTKAFPVPAIIGTVIACIVLIAIILAIAIVLIWRRKQISHQKSPVNSEAVYYNEGHTNDNKFQEEQSSKKDVNILANTMDKSYTTKASMVAAIDEEKDIDDVYLNEELNSTENDIANKSEAKSAKNKDINITSEYCNQDSHYNTLEKTNNEHVYSEIDITDGNKDVYYNTAPLPGNKDAYYNVVAL